MHLKSAIITTSILSALAGTANAADVISTYEPAPDAVAETAPIVPHFSWDGTYIGGHAGYVAGKLNYNDEMSSEKVKTNGYLGGIYAGYNYDAGSNLILGAEFDANYSAIKNSINDPWFNASHKIRWSGAARARAGYAIDRFMPYIAGGLTVANFKDKVDMGNLTASRNRTQSGWTAGAGVDYAATDNLILRVEYRYSDFGRQKYNSDIVDLNLTSKLKTNEIRVGAAYKF